MSNRSLLTMPIRLVCDFILTNFVSVPSRRSRIVVPIFLSGGRQLGILSPLPLPRAKMTGGRSRWETASVNPDSICMLSSGRNQKEFHFEPTSCKIGLQSQYERSETGFCMTLIFTSAAAVLLGLFSWEKLKKGFVVEAAKPFNDSRCETNSFGREEGIRLSSSTSKSSGSLKRRQEFNFVADVVEAVGGSVVCIEVKDNTMIDWITGKPELMSNGSGFIISEDGLILTNAHVVVGRNKMSLSVRLHDGRTFPAHVEDVDLNSDLAIIRIKSRGLPTMPLGSSSETRIGEWVVALGSPLSLTNTVTAGVVSSVSRKANELGINVNDISYIQTDAAITFGNSGGPLVNLDGEAIGINSMKVAAGISFAIPIDYAKLYLADAERRRVAGYKKPKRRYMGATLLTLTDDLVRELHASNTIIPQVSRGVLVWKVVIGSPAYKCGLKPGDIIYKVNGMDITSATPIFDMLQNSECLKFHVIRRDAAASSLVCVMYPEEVPEEN